MKRNAVLGLTLLFFVPCTLLAQATGTISGVVTGTNNVPVGGAAVTVSGTTRSVQSDAQGRFTFTAVPAGSQTLRANSVGYTEATRTVTIVAGQTATVAIALTAQVVQLEEVVAIGYGTARRRDVAGAVSSIQPAETSVDVRQPSSALAGALQGKATGVQVVSQSGAPGAGVTVRVRGSNSIVANSEPLYVIDGLPVTQGGSLAGLDASDVASMEVLKDASQTAIYGARGANGVILITTKRGTRGLNQVQMEASYGVQKISREIEVLDALQFMELTNEANLYSGRAARYSQAQLDSARAGTMQTYNYVDAILRRAPMTNYQLSVSGGDQSTRYLIGGSYSQQDGIIRGTSFGRYGARLNLDRTLSSRFRAGNSLSLTYVLQHAPAGDGIINTALAYIPNIPFKDAQGNWIRDLTTFGIQGIGSNPLAQVTEAVNDQHSWRGVGNVYGEFDIMEELTLRSTFGGNFSFGKTGTYNPRTIAGGFNTNGSASINTSNGRELTNENTLQYRREVGPGNLDVLVGTTIQLGRNESANLSGQGFPTDRFTYNNLGISSATNRTVTSGRNESALLSQFSRLNYNLLDRYLFTATVRRDGSSRFGENNKWAIFPSGALAWRIVDEPFMRNQSFFDDLKFRISYGKTGNQAIGAYESLDLLTTQYWGVGRPATEQVAISPPASMANPSLRWETSSQANIGLDLGFFDGRLVMSADAYQSTTTDLLFRVDLPSQTGRTSQLQNVGSVRNRGVELALNTVNWEGEFFGWRTNLNLSRNNSEVLALSSGVTEFLPGGEVQGIDGTGLSIVRVGEPLGSLYGYRTDGLFQQGDACPFRTPSDCAPGELKYIDTNADSAITSADRVIIGNGDPDFYGGLTSEMTFGPISVDAFFNFSYGNEMANTSLAYNGLSKALANERADVALRRWTPTNTNTDVPRANNARIGRLTNYIVDDASFLRLQSLTIGYTVPQGLIPMASDARLYVNGQNLFLLTGYNGFDPEAASRGSSSVDRGIDSGAYPRARTWNVGAQLSF